jgi:hypothetical protein
MLTKADIEKLCAPLPLQDHEVKIKVAPRKDDKGEMKKSMWLTYIDQTAIIPLILDVDPNYGWQIIDKQRHPGEKLCVVTGRLIICEAARDGVGGATPNYDKDPYSEDTEKAAETDALKRAAVKFGIGLYTRNLPQIWVDGNLGDGYKAKDAAWAQFEAWYRKTYGNGTQRQQPPAAPNVTTLPPTADSKKAFTTQEAGKKWSLSWADRNVSSEFLLNALQVNKLSEYVGTIESANSAVEQAIADASVEFGTGD